jgi:hypothetical protein
MKGRGHRVNQFPGIRTNGTTRRYKWRGVLKNFRKEVYYE